MSPPGGMEGSICGVWIDDDGRAHVSVTGAGDIRQERTMPFEPFAWVGGPPPEKAVPGVVFERLQGGAALGTLLRAQ